MIIFNARLTGKPYLKLILSMILLSGFSTAHALEFKSFNFNDESACSEQLGQLAVSLPYDIKNVNHLSKSKEICLQAYTGDNACRKEYNRQKDALGLTSGIRSNHSAEQEKKAQQQCGGWLQGRLSACVAFLRKASAVCHQIRCEVEDSDIGDSYSGDCQNGKAHGYGTARGRDTYQGNYKNGKLHGYGVYTWADGGRHEGNWANGKQHGYGVKTWDDGTRYEGNYKNGKRHGQGVKTWASGSRYVGNYKNDKRHGQGVYTWPDGSRYAGNLANGKSHGYGVKTWASGSRYEGNFKNGERTGYGIYTWSNGNTTSGNWVNGKCPNCQRRKR